MEDWLTYLLIGVIMINVFVFAKKHLFKKTIREGYETISNSDGEEKQNLQMKDRPGAILANTEPHHVGKMKKNYKDMYQNLHSNVSYNMHNIVRNHGVDISKNPMHPESLDKMNAYTVMHNFRQSLDEGYKHLTKAE